MFIGNVGRALTPKHCLKLCRWHRAPAVQWPPRLTAAGLRESVHSLHRQAPSPLVAAGLTHVQAYYLASYKLCAIHCVLCGSVQWERAPLEPSFGSLWCMRASALVLTQSVRHTSRATLFDASLSLLASDQNRTSALNSSIFESRLRLGRIRCELSPRPRHAHGVHSVHW